MPGLLSRHVTHGAAGDRAMRVAGPAGKARIGAVGFSGPAGELPIFMDH